MKGGKWCWMGLGLLAGLMGLGCRRAEAPPRRVPLRLTFWHIQSYEPTKGVIQRAVERFQAHHPEVEVQVVPIQADLYKNKLQVALAGNRGPDVFHTWGGGVLAAYVEEGKVFDLTEAVAQGGWEQTFLPTALEFCRVKGRLYALPMDVGIVPIWYHRSLFKEQGLKPPQSWRELLEVCRRLRAQGLIPFALGNKDQWPGAFFYIYLVQRLGGTEEIRRASLRQKGASFTAKPFVEAGKRLRELVEVGAFPEGFNGLNLDQARRLFFTKKAAMMLMGSWLLAHAQQEAPALLPQLGLFPFPPVEGGRGDPKVLVGGVNAAYAISSQCAHPEVAIELLRTLTDALTLREWAQTGRLPAGKGILEHTEVPSLTRSLFALLEAAPEVQLYFDQLLGPEVGKRHLEAVQGLLAGTLSPEEAARWVEEAAQKGRIPSMGNFSAEENDSKKGGL